MLLYGTKALLYKLHGKDFLQILQKAYLIFSDIPFHNIIPEIIPPKELDNELIKTLLKNPNITCYFALQDTTFFAQLKLSVLIFVMLLYRQHKLLYRQHILFAT